jgi:hypothetical protein
MMTIMNDNFCKYRNQIKAGFNKIPCATKCNFPLANPVLLANSHSTPTPTNRHVVNTKLTKPGFEAALLFASVRVTV